MRKLVLFAVGTLSWLAASAAEVTELPPQLRGDVSLTYGADLFRAPLVEAGTRIGGARRATHDLRIDLAFAPTNGVAVTAGLELAPSRTSGFATDGNQIVYDPVSDTGSFLDGDPLDAPPQYRGNGLVGIWVGAAVGPYGRWMKAQDEFSWRLDVGLRVPNSGGAFYAAGDGKRGAAPGGTALRVAGAFAREADFAEVYLTGAYQYEGRATIDIGDEINGNTLEGASIQEPSHFDLRFGSEFITLQDREKGLKVAFDLYGRAGWQSAAKIASGVYLPEVLDRSRRIEVFQSETLYAGAGFGLIVNPTKAIGFRVAGDLTAYTPFRVEHVYNVEYGAGAHSVGIHAAVNGRWR